MSIFKRIKELFTGPAPADAKQDDSHLAPYKIESQDAIHSAVVDTTTNWPFPTAETAKPVAAMTPAKKKKPAAKKAPAKSTAAPAKKAPAKPKAKPAAKKAPKSQ